MPAAKCSDEDFIRLFRELGATEVSKTLGVSVRNIQARRQRLEHLHNIAINSPSTTKSQERKIGSYPRRLQENLLNGRILIGSDAHVWPGDLEPGHKSFIKMAEIYQPEIITLNGDVLDGARISRHPPLQWSHTPTLREELDAVDNFLDSVRTASKKSKLFWIMGNHDCRFESKLSIQVPEFANVDGTKLIDHFPHWVMGFSLWVNNGIVIKHRFKGGIHATTNGTLWAGKTLVTGHLHALQYRPLSDYNGTRFGVDTGTLSDPYGDHAAYTEDNPLNHRAGGVLLTIKDGELLYPELFAVIDENRFQFRGEIISL